MSSPLSNVAVIGAGLGGCAVALALASKNIPVTVYESRASSAEPAKSGVLLTPNGLRVLDRLGVFSRIRARCYVATHRCFLDDADRLVRKTRSAGEELYGYAYHRLWRSVLLDELRAMLRERGVPVHFDSRFTGVIEDPASPSSPSGGGGGGVTFAINGLPVTASLLVASDGLHSAVRQHVSPGVEPEYTGIIGVLSHIRRDAVAWPTPDYEHNATIQGSAGAIFWIPEDAGSEDIMIGLQTAYPEQSRADLDALQRDPDRMVGFYTEHYDRWGATARKIIDEVVRRKETAYAWPYMKMPKLERWHSGSGRVILMGDGAHALPPSSGQGVNQALEDAYALVLLLAGVEEGKTGLLDALAFWQEMRQRRVDGVLDWANNYQNVERLPEAERKRLIEEGKFKPGDANQNGLDWLYRPILDDEVAAWFAGRA